MKRLALGILGALLGLVGLGLLGGGSVLLSLFGTDGEADIPIGRVSGDQVRAVVVTDFQISSSTALPVDETWFDLRLEVTGEDPLFVGVAGKPDSLQYLQGVPYELVTGIDSSSDSLDSTTIPGDRVPPDPGAEAFWTDQQTGRKASVAWPVSNSDKTLVVMNRDAAKGVAADVSVIATVTWIGPLAVGMVIAGVVLVGLAILLLILAFRTGGNAPPSSQHPMASAQSR